MMVLLSSGGKISKENEISRCQQFQIEHLSCYVVEAEILDFRNTCAFIF